LTARPFIRELSGDGLGWHIRPSCPNFFALDLRISLYDTHSALFLDRPFLLRFVLLLLLFIEINNPPEALRAKDLRGDASFNQNSRKQQSAGNLKGPWT
jgi:hypothetical protein